MTLNVAFLIQNLQSAFPEATLLSLNRPCPKRLGK